MKTKRNITSSKASTYALLARSEAAERALSETLVYALLIGSAALSVWYAAAQPFRVPVAVVVENAVITHAAAPRAERV